MKKSILIVGLLLCAQQEALASSPALQTAEFRQTAQRAFAHILRNMDSYRERAVSIVRAQELASHLSALPAEPHQVIREFLQEQLQERRNDSAEHGGAQVKRADELIASADIVESLWGKPEFARFLRRIATAMKEEAQCGRDTGAARVDGLNLPIARECQMSVEDQIRVEFFEMMRDYTRKNKEIIEKMGTNLQFLKRRSDSAKSVIRELQQQAQEARVSLKQLEENAQVRENRLVRLEVARQRERYLLSSFLIGIFGVIVWQLIMVGN